MLTFPSIQYILISSIVLIILFLSSYLIGILDLKGTIAAVIFGGIVMFLDSMSWLAILVVFLLISYFATRYKFDYKKSANTSEGSDGKRHFSNVFYAGMMALFIAVANFISPYPYHYFVLFSAAIASITADTFGSEIGVVDSNTYLITTFKRVRTGTNGGISLLGEFATLFGALIIGVTYVLLSSSHNLIAGLVGVTMAGFAAAHVDSILGATLENRNIMNKGQVNFLASLSSVLIAIPFFMYF
ncbi:MAG: DUF92 domain-containing protein [Candidatus Thermoplasmatota archaeon]|jgi:uncharacterized protein (TIGR00297 family)|nr:DUF92 domain-containing protein [Candidatus Thermoplasmatota archaeon]